MAKQKPDPAPKYNEDEAIIKEARDRFKRAQDWEATARVRYMEDIRFVNGDSENGYQWPADTRKNRDGENRPVLTVNKVRQYCLNITNDAKQNKASIKVRPSGKNASYDGAQVMEGIIRYIEYKSNASAAYLRAMTTQVQGGVGYWRVMNQYAGPDSFDQELVIKTIKNAMSVYLDPDAVEADKSDMKFAFIFEDMADDAFEAAYPGKLGALGTSNLAPNLDWLDKDKTRVCEYYRVYPRADKLIQMLDPESGQSTAMYASEISSTELRKLAIADPTSRVRDVTVNEVQWFKIAGDSILEKGKWCGTTIPIVQIYGEETVIEGKMDRKGHVRALKDPQRIYNYWTSSAVEFVALQSKAPFIGPAAAIEGYENYWRTANTVNHSLLPYNHRDDEGNEIPPPQRQNPPVMAPAYLQGLQIASDEMRMASGQFHEDLGEPSNAVSGKAINARQRQGDNATYHYIEHQGIGIQYTGRILIECIPKIYDTQRILHILGEDGVQTEVVLDPEAQMETQKQVAAAENKARVIFNPAFAKYAVEADIGPAYATRRQEAFNAFTQIMAQSPDLMKVAGDLMFRAADFPMADELADRLVKMVPPFVLGKGPDPQTQQLIQQNQNLNKTVETLIQQYADEKAKRETDMRDTQIDSFKAETDRIKVLLAGFDPNAVASMTAQLVLQTLQTNLPGTTRTNRQPLIPKDAARPEAPDGAIEQGLTPPGADIAPLRMPNAQPPNGP